jgi:hypothetical protein
MPAGADFVVDGDDHWRRLDRRQASPTRQPAVAPPYDLAVVSVLLDAGAGPDWRYRDAPPAARSAVPKGWRSPRSTCSLPALFQRSG